MKYVLYQIPRILYSSRSRGRGTARIWNRVLDTEAVDEWVLDTTVEDTHGTWATRIFILKRVK